MRRDRIWRKVQDHLVKPLSTNPLELAVSVTFKDNEFLADRDAHLFAEELLSLVREASFRTNQLAIYTDHRETEMWSRAGIETATVPDRYQLVYTFKSSTFGESVTTIYSGHALWLIRKNLQHNIERIDP